jgi:hypothetical protein
MTPLGTTAPIRLELTNTVGRTFPLKRTWLPATKLLPFTATDGGVALTTAEAGESELTTGTGFSIASGVGFERPPPGAGFDTSMVAMPVPIAVKTAVSCEELTNVVVSGWPPRRTTLTATKPDPVTVRVEGAPTRIVVGERFPIDGTGFSTVRVKAGEEVPPPGLGLLTVIAWFTAVDTSAAATVALTWVGLTNVVVKVDPSRMIAVEAL